MGWECIAFWIEKHTGLAAWMQAAFSVIAIAAAGYFPIAHEKRRERRARLYVLRSLDFLAGPLGRHIMSLKEALSGEDSRNKWIEGDGSKKLKLIGQALHEIPASMVVAIELSLLIDLRLAYGYAAEIDCFARETPHDDVATMFKRLRYVELCETSINDIKLVQETLQGLSLRKS